MRDSFARPSENSASINCSSPKHRLLCSMEEAEIYHEKQRLQLCALHALNNLFQDPKAFTQKEMDEISRNLSPDAWICPHKSPIGFGNYDVNVLMAALQTRGYECIWFDRRREVSSIHLDEIFGFIINIPYNVKLRWLTIPVKRPHWIALRKLGKDFFNLDSKLDEPECLGESEELQKFLQSQLQNESAQLFLIVTSSVAEGEAWKKT